MIKHRLYALTNNLSFMHYVKNTSWLMAERILRVIVGGLVFIWMARYLGPENLGTLSYCLAFVALFHGLTTLGLDNIVVLNLVNNQSDRNTLLGTAFVLKLAGSLLVTSGLVILVNLLNYDKNIQLMIVIIASATLFQSSNVIDYYFQSKILSKYVVYANSITLIISSMTKIILIIQHAPLLYFALVSLLDSLIIAIGLFYFYIRQHLNPGSWKFSAVLAAKLLKQSWPLMLSSLVIAIYMKIDQVMLNEMIGADMVGQYAAAVRISEAWYFIPIVICGSLFPAIINAGKQNPHIYQNKLQKLYELMVWLAIIVAIPVSFSGDWIINLLYGSQYHQAGGVLMLHIWSGIFVFLGVASGKWLIAEHLQHLSFYRSLCGVLINIALNFWFIPRYSVFGAALATLISQFFSGYLFDLFNHSTREVFFMKTRAIFLINSLKKIPGLFKN